MFFLGDIPDLMKTLEHAIYSNKPKNVDIFPLAEKVKYYCTIHNLSSFYLNLDLPSSIWYPSDWL
jgi:hypothetical protein